MNTRHLFFVLNVAQTGSFSAAAQLSNVTQPTLSAGVKQIEEQLGARLFERNTRQVALTEFGREILPFIRDVVDGHEALLLQAKSQLEPKRKLVRIGLSPVVEVGKVLGALAPFRQKNPDVEFVFKECFMDDLGARLGSGQVDLAIWPDLNAVQSNFASTHIYLDPWIFLPNSAGTTFQPGIPLPLSDFSDEPLILTQGYCGLSQATEALFEKMNHDLKTYPGRAISYAAIEEWADLGLGAGLLPASKVSTGREGRAIPVLTDTRKAAMLNIIASWKPLKREPAHFEEVIDYLETTRAAQAPAPQS